VAGNFVTYKLSPRNVSFEKADLKRLTDYIVQKNREAHDIHRNSINFDTISAEQRDPIWQTLEEAYQTAIFIYGDGEELLVYNSTIFDSPEFPEVISRVSIDTFISISEPNGWHTTQKRSSGGFGLLNGKNS